MFRCVRFLSVRLVCGESVQPVEVRGYVVEFIARVLMISACSGSGFKFAPALAETVAELLFDDNQTSAFPSIRIESWY
jgi:glycine/D-amino acid oxidase-like deaminating enzyme